MCHGSAYGDGARRRCCLKCRRAFRHGFYQGVKLLDHIFHDFERNNAHPHIIDLVIVHLVFTPIHVYFIPGFRSGI